jgi:hypothetical protein
VKDLLGKKVKSRSTKNMMLTKLQIMVAGIGIAMIL